MNIVTTHEPEYGLIKIPKVSGLGSYQIRYDHKTITINQRQLDVEVTATLMLLAVLEGDKKYDVTSVKSKYSIEVKEMLTAHFMEPLWINAGNELLIFYKKFRKSKGWNDEQIEPTETGSMLTFLVSLIYEIYNPPKR